LPLSPLTQNPLCLYPAFSKDVFGNKQRPPDRPPPLLFTFYHCGILLCQNLLSTGDFLLVPLGSAQFVPGPQFSRVHPLKLARLEMASPSLATYLFFSGVRRFFWFLFLWFSHSYLGTTSLFVSFRPFSPQIATPIILCLFQAPPVLCWLSVFLDLAMFGETPLFSIDVPFSSTVIVLSRFPLPVIVAVKIPFPPSLFARGLII